MVLGQNVHAQYIEKIDGLLVDGIRAMQIQGFMRTVWEKIKESMPVLWGKADAEVKKEYYRKMSLQFFVFRLCDLHWYSLGQPESQQIVPLTNLTLAANGLAKRQQRSRERPSWKVPQCCHQ